VRESGRGCFEVARSSWGNSPIGFFLGESDGFFDDLLDAAGAGIGGLATQSGRGVGIGAAAGAAVGLAAVLLTRGPDAEMPRGSTVEAVIDRSLYLDADKVQFTGPGQASSLAGPANREPVRNKDPF